MEEVKKNETIKKDEAIKEKKKDKKVIKETENEEKIKAVKIKSRQVKNLIEIPVNEMTEKEKDSLIKYYREQITIKDVKIEELNKNIIATREQVQIQMKEVEKCDIFYRGEIKYIKDQLEVCMQAVDRSIMGGL